MKVVLDTNCFISCIGKKSSHCSVFDAFLNEKFDLCLSTEILLEYEEKFIQFWGAEVTHNLLATVLTSRNIHLSSVFYNFNLVEGDADDNKFADIYLSSGADILVTNDTKLLALGKLDYPPFVVMTLAEFHQFLQNAQ